MTPTPGDQQQEDDFQLAGVFRTERGGDAAMGEFGMAEQVVQPDDAGQQCRAADQRVGEVDRAALHGLVGAAMHDQRKGRQRQQFVEDEKGEQIRRHGDAHRGRHTQAEEAEKAAAVRRAFQVADGVERGEQPEDGGQRDEKHAECVGLQRQFQTGQHRITHAVLLAGRHAGQQQGDQAQLGYGGEQVEGRAHADPRFRQREDDEAGQQRGRQHRQRQQFVAGHVAPPSNCINSTPRRPSSTLAAASAKALHSRVRGTGVSVVARRRSEEGLAQHAQDIDGRQQAAGETTTTRLQWPCASAASMSCHLARKPAGRRQPHQGHAGQAEGEQGHRQPLDRAGQTGHRILPRGLDQHAGGGEHGGFGQTVGESPASRRPGARPGAASSGKIRNR